VRPSALRLTLQVFALNELARERAHEGDHRAHLGLDADAQTIELEFGASEMDGVTTITVTTTGTGR
jgi:hypothetical protein